jgi:phosphomannomutase
MIKFGTDGWRGIISEDYTFNNVRLVSHAIADYILGRGEAPKASSSATTPAFSRAGTPRAAPPL